LWGRSPKSCGMVKSGSKLVRPWAELWDDVGERVQAQNGKFPRNIGAEPARPANFRFIILTPGL